MIDRRRLTRLMAHRKQALDQTRAALHQAEAEQRAVQAKLGACERLVGTAQEGQRNLITQDVFASQYLQAQEWLSTCEAKLLRTQREHAKAQATVRSARGRVESARIALKKLESLELRVKGELRKCAERAERREEDELSGQMARGLAAGSAIGKRQD